MLRTWLLVLVALPALASPGASWHNSDIERVRAQLRSIGMATDTPVKWRTLKRNWGVTSQGKRIRISRAIPNRAHLVNTLAHEMKHVRDYAPRLARNREISRLLVANRRLQRQAIPGTPRFDGVIERINANQRRTDWLLQLNSSDAAETRANRAGAYALGRLGRSLGNVHLDLPDDPKYASRDHLLRANITGYTLGAKVALLKSPQYRALGQLARWTARQRINDYLGGYAALLRVQAEEHYSQRPDPTFDPPGRLSEKLRGAREQRSARRLSTQKKLSMAGWEDAWRGLSPLGRTVQLLKR